MRKVDIRTLEGLALNVEDAELREALLAIVDILKKHEQEILHIMTYAEGVR